MASSVCFAGAMRIVTVGILQKEDLTCNHASSHSLARTDKLQDSLAKEYTWSQVEPALAILCACLVTLRPLFINLNLNIPKYSTRFSRSKSLSSSKATNSSEINQERGSHRQWPGVQDPRRADSTRLDSIGTSITKGGLHIVNIDLGTRGPIHAALLLREQR